MEQSPTGPLSGAASLRCLLRALAGPAARRLRREAQWALHRDLYRLEKSPEPFRFLVALHATPLMRPLLGLDEQLQLNKVVNLRLAAGRLDGLVLPPGKRLSFWRHVGRPARRRGFLDGMVLHRGMIRPGVGGGLCQLTNLLYWMTLHTPLTIHERWRHGYDVFPDAQRDQPFGSGATCSWPALDLQIGNPTGVPYRLSADLTDTHLAGSWTAEATPGVEYRIEERAHAISHEYPGVYTRRNELWRIARDLTTSVTTEEMIASNHALMMYPPFLPPPGSRGPAIAPDRGTVPS
jgi:vancomycin resistance protein VanW